MISGCCPPLALPRSSLGGEIIGFDEKTGQFVQASAGVGATRIVEYPYYASAGMGQAAPLSLTQIYLGAAVMGLMASIAFATGFIVGTRAQ